MTAAHTPGPWKYSPPDDQVVDLFTPEYFFIEGPGADVHGHMTLADARLIAAAPDLLEALHAMASSFHDVEYMDGVEGHKSIASNMARAAITKATGEKA